MGVRKIHFEGKEEIIMKKTLATLLAVMMLTPAFAMADAANDTTADAAVETEAAATAAEMYEIENNLDDMTVRMPANATTGYEWKYEVSDESKLELITSEYVTAAAENSEGVVGVGGEWAASFKRADDAVGDVTLTLTYAKGDEAPLYTVVMQINLDNAITIKSVANGEETPWVEAANGGEVNVTLAANPTTGYAWTYTASDPAMFEATENYTEDAHEEGALGVGGTWTMKLVPTMVSAGSVVATFDYARADEAPIESRSVTLFVDESGAISISTASAALSQNQAE